jgi:hypothetical protein
MAGPAATVQQRRQERPIAAGEPDSFATELALQYGDLTAQSEDLRVLAPVSTGSCDRRLHAIDAVLKSRGIIEGSLAFARPAFPSPVAPRWPGRSWA